MTVIRSDRSTALPRAQVGCHTSLKVNGVKSVNIRRSAWCVLLLAIMVVTLTGCGPYKLKGRVVQGDASRIAKAGRDDSRWNQPPVGEVRVLVTLDPRRLDHEQVGEGRSEADGSFAIPIDAFGAGVLEHQVQIAAMKDKYTTAARVLSLPGENERLLIVLTPGRSEKPAKKGSVLDETIEMSEPYLDEPGLGPDEQK